MNDADALSGRAKSNPATGRPDDGDPKEARTFDEWLAAHGRPETDDPVTVMTRVLAETVAWYDFTRQLVADLSTADWESRGRDGSVQLAALIGVFERAADRAHRHLVDFLRLGLEERLVRVTEAQGAAIVKVILATLADLGLGDLEDEARQLAAGHLELVAGGAP